MKQQRKEKYANVLRRLSKSTFYGRKWKAAMGHLKVVKEENSKYPGGIHWKMKFDQFANSG